MSEINTSPEIGELVKALAQAQLEFAPVHKGSDNPYYTSKYADLATVIRATQPALAKHGLVVMQWPCNYTQVQEAGVISILAHSSGQWKRFELILPATGFTKGGGIKYDAQTVGIAITYARRYSYQAIVGVAAEMDDDANSIGEPAGTKQAAQSVADRKIADYKAKKATGGDLSHETEKQAPPPPTGNETITLTSYKDGSMALSGNGLNVVRASMSKDDRDFFKIKYYKEDGIFAFPAALAFKFQDMCTRLNVGTQIMGAETQTRGPMAPEKAVIPPMAEIIGGKQQPSTDPILMDCVRVEKDKDGKPRTKPFLDVGWNGRHHYCFNKDIWPILESAKGKPIMLELKENGKYSNIVRILRVDGIDFE